MLTANDLKVGIIATVAKLSNLTVLQRLYDQTQQEVTALEAAADETTPLTRSVVDFGKGVIDIRSQVSKEQLFREEGNKRPSFLDWQRQAAQLDWDERPLREMLALLD